MRDGACSAYKKSYDLVGCIAGDSVISVSQPKAKPFINLMWVRVSL